MQIPAVPRKLAVLNTRPCSVFVDLMIDAIGPRNFAGMFQTGTALQCNTPLYLSFNVGAALKSVDCPKRCRSGQFLLHGCSQEPSCLSLPLCDND